MAKAKGTYFAHGKYPGDILDKVGNINATGSILNKSKYSIRGAIAGALVGFVGFSFFNKSKLAGAAIGGIVGAFAGTIYNKIDENIKMYKEFVTNKTEQSNGSNTNS